MKRQQPIEVFTPPNILKAQVGGSGAGLDMAAVKRAEQALATLKTEFSDWIAADVQNLVERRDAFKSGQTPDRQDDLYRASHDLRGQARTFEFPLVERVASSLCRLLDGAPAADALALVDAHVGAIHIIVRDKIKDHGDAVATTLAKELEARVNQFLASSRPKPSP
jgi:hypothetical protein